MGRKQMPPAEIAVGEVNTEVLAQAGAAASELVLLEDQLQTRVRAIADSVGYLLPADATDPDLIQRDIAANMRRSVEACLEVGRGLRVLKEACGHGNFMARLDVLGIDPSVAGRFIHAAVRFSNSPPAANLIKAIGNQSKLFELLVLSDDQFDELATTGQTGDLTQDDVAAMSKKELRTAVREAKEALIAKQRVLDAANTERDALKEKALRPYKPKKGNPAQDADEAAALDELFSVVLQMDGLLGRLGNVVRDLQSNEREPMRQRGLEAMRHVVTCVREIVMDHGLDVDTSADAIGGMPSWLDLDAIADAQDPQPEKSTKAGKA